MSDDLAIYHATVLSNAEIAPEHRVMRMSAPEIAARALPGQFVMVRALGTADPLLPRAYSVYAADPTAGWIEVLYRVVGNGTRRLELYEASQKVHVWGPLGNAFQAPQGRAILVGGGVGIPPLSFWAQHLAGSDAEVVTLIGAATERFLVGLDRFRESGSRLETATDDGSAGHKGYVTDLLDRWLDAGPATVYACGPMPMLRSVARIVEARGVPAELALEAPMACGVGACLGCTVPRREGGYARVCTDGPVFAATAIAW